MVYLKKVKDYDNEEQFMEILDKFKKAYRNSLLSQPYETASSLISDAITDPSRSIDESLQYLNLITWATFKDFNSKILRDKVGFTSAV